MSLPTVVKSYYPIDKTFAMLSTLMEYPTTKWQPAAQLAVMTVTNVWKETHIAFAGYTIYWYHDENGTSLALQLVFYGFMY